MAGWHPGTNHCRREYFEVPDLLESDSSSYSDGVSAVHVGTVPWCVKVAIQGVSMYGVVDTGADITIIGGRLFKLVATKARIKKRNFQTTQFHITMMAKYL